MEGMEESTNVVDVEGVNGDRAFGKEGQASKGDVMVGAVDPP